MKQLFFIAPSLSSIEVTRKALKALGVRHHNLHVLTNRQGDADRRALNPVSSLNRNDMIRWISGGFLVGCVVSMVLLLGISLLGGLQSLSGISNDLEWLVMCFISAMVTGFCSWEAGLLGLHKHNHKYAKFQEAIDQDKHVFFVDVDTHNEAQIKSLCLCNNDLAYVGDIKVTLNPFAAGSLSMARA